MLRENKQLPANPCIYKPKDHSSWNMITGSELERTFRSFHLPLLDALLILCFLQQDVKSLRQRLELSYYSLYRQSSSYSYSIYPFITSKLKLKRQPQLLALGDPLITYHFPLEQSDTFPQVSIANCQAMNLEEALSFPRAALG
ncbi:Ammonium transporter 1 [Fusarium oxysporum f. sp. albedinis]|nr:Ammonium transporter 1 [Fusarium oxysporum f. sp. albedinis]